MSDDQHSIAAVPDAPAAPAAPAEAGPADALLLRQRAELEAAGGIVRSAMESGDGEQARVAKLIVDTLRAKHEAERRAHGMDDDAPSGPQVVNIVWKA